MSLVKTTQVVGRQVRARMAKEAVCALLGWDEMNYCEYQLKQGRQYLHHRMHRDPSMYDYFETTRIYWSWWRNQWLERDEYFLANDAQGNYGSWLDRMIAYDGLHHYLYLANEIHPTYEVMEKSYARMVGLVVKEVVGG